ncbi:hypothetical protein ACFFQW_11420 [Umezawaea endophytica]|uniref:FHA domain-containing protein n=1 Tax=Umezawaea endophytica TaxID=1654476 RepID=A0A9X3AI38_9PSEU|nr:hypothetical protein [Umezawaea endophytica]MCS7482552.1 hypothetical protein [Umezawaea endophytica]
MAEERPNELPATHHSLALGPKEGRTVPFGRSRPDVHVCVGEDDLRISREHGALTHRGDQRWISTRGRLPLGSTQGFTATPGGESNPSGSTGQETRGWGAPVWQDDFNGTAVGSQWGVYTDPRSRHGNRQPSQCQVSGGSLKLAESDEWNDGEYVWVEKTAGGNCCGGFMHYPGDSRRQEVLPQNSASCVGSNQRHHVAFEWTASSLKGWADGRL